MLYMVTWLSRQATHPSWMVLLAKEMCQCQLDFLGPSNHCEWNSISLLLPCRYQELPVGAHSPHPGHEKYRSSAIHHQWSCSQADGSHQQHQDCRNHHRGHQCHCSQPDISHNFAQPKLAAVHHNMLLNCSSTAAGGNPSQIPADITEAVACNPIMDFTR